MYLTVQIMLQIHPRRHLRKCKQHSFRLEMLQSDWLFSLSFTLGAGRPVPLLIRLIFILVK